MNPRRCSAKAASKIDFNSTVRGRNHTEEPEQLSSICLPADLKVPGSVGTLQYQSRVKLSASVTLAIGFRVKFSC